ncbi:MAG: AraC family transcriptional regulator [Prevotella sp.]|nr:AraC family transcriptional regulator [Prevotella sp.]
MQKSKYLVCNDKDEQWGLTISTVGYEDIAPGDPYPTTGHADGYYFDVEKGRELNEYQMLYTVEGEGEFESASSSGRIRVKEGDVFLLFPGEWHTYHPDPQIGWKQYWIGFKGRNMDDRVAAGFLSAGKSVYHIGYSTQIISLYKDAMQAAMEEKAYMQQLLAGIVNHLIGLMYALERNIILNKNTAHVDMVMRAQQYIRESLESTLSIQDIAERLGVSYSTLRKQFKDYTGLSPAIYQQDLKLQRAKELLTTTSLSIKEIAYRLNFDSPDYFSAKFKVKTGRKPSEMRGKK